MAASISLAVVCGAGQAAPHGAPEQEASHPAQERSQGATPKSGQQPRIRQPRTKTVKLLSGALFADDFEDGLDLRKPGDRNDPDAGGKWSLWNLDPMIRVGVEDGALAIKGTSSGTRTINFNGLVGRVHRETDVILVTDVKVVAPDENLPGIHVAMAHLCGRFPDHFNELSFGRSKDGHVGWRQVQDGGYVPEAGAIEGFGPYGDEHERWYTLKLEHRSDTEESRAWVLREGTWKEVGTAHAVVMASSRVELKVNVPTPDMPVETWFDNCRLYLRPETHPARFLVHAAGGGLVIEGARVELALEGDEETLLTATTNALGWADLSLPADRLYPLAAKMRIEFRDGSTWEHAIEKSPGEGLYPGDVWITRVTRFEVSRPPEDESPKRKRTRR